MKPISVISTGIRAQCLYIILLSHVLSKTIGSTLDDFKFRCVWENDVLWEVGQLVYFVCLHQTNTDISGTINMKLNCLTIGIRQKHIELLYVRKPVQNLKKVFTKPILTCYTKFHITYWSDCLLIFLITWMKNKYILSVSETVLYQL